MKQKDLKMGMIVEHESLSHVYGAIVAIKEHIDGNIYVDLMKNGDYNKDVDIKEIKLLDQLDRNTKFISLQKVELEMYTESGEKVHIKNVTPT